MVSRQWRPQEGYCWLHHCQVVWSTDIHEDIKYETDKQLSSLLCESSSFSLCQALLLMRHREDSPVLGATVLARIQALRLQWKLC